MQTEDYKKHRRDYIYKDIVIRLCFYYTTNLSQQYLISEENSWCYRSVIYKSGSGSRRLINYGSTLVLYTQVLYALIAKNIFNDKPTK